MLVFCRGGGGQAIGVVSQNYCSVFLRWRRCNFHLWLNLSGRAREFERPGRDGKDVAAGAARASCHDVRGAVESLVSSLDEADSEPRA